MLDICGFEKDTAGYYRANWLPDGPAYVKLAPSDWTAPVPVGTPIVLRAFTGAAAVEAFVNGVSLGRVQVAAFEEARWPAVPFQVSAAARWGWGCATRGASRAPASLASTLATPRLSYSQPVSFVFPPTPSSTQPGNITAVAYSAAGSVVATTTVATTGAPAALRVTLVDVGPPTYAADGSDVAIFSVEVVDAGGALVPSARVPLTFAVSSGPGVIYGVGNGDPADHTPDKVGMPDLPYGGVWARASWMGLARAIVQGQAGKPGQVSAGGSACGEEGGGASRLYMRCGACSPSGSAAPAPPRARGERDLPLVHPTDLSPLLLASPQITLTVTSPGLTSGSASFVTQ